jgi:hypothetical protein
MKIKTLMTPNLPDEYEHTLTHMRDDSADKDYEVLKRMVAGLPMIDEDQKARKKKIEGKIDIRNRQSQAANMDADFLKRLVQPENIDLTKALIREGFGLKLNQGNTSEALETFDPTLKEIIKNHCKSEKPKATEVFMAKITNDHKGNYDNKLMITEKFYDEVNNKIIDTKPDNKSMRSIDAMWDDEGFALAISMKYKGGTAAGDGSGQLDQLTECHKNIGRAVENADSQLTYNGKPTFVVLDVYGAQVSQSRRIQTLEAHILKINQGRPFRRVITCSADMLPRVANEIKELVGKGVAYDDVCSQALNNIGHEFELDENLDSFNTFKEYYGKDQFTNLFIDATNELTV